MESRYKIIINKSIRWQKVASVKSEAGKDFEFC